MITGTASLQSSEARGKGVGTHYYRACIQLSHLCHRPAPMDPLIFHGFAAGICHRSRYLYYLLSHDVPSNLWGPL